jgi:cytochrome c556
MRRKMNIILKVSVLMMTISLMISPLAFADGEAEFKYRQGVMRTVGGQMTSMAAILRGQVHFDSLAFHARGMAELAEIVPHVFPEGSGVSKSEALPAIWKDADDFKEKLTDFVEAANGMAKAAETGDMGAVGPAMKALGQSCKGCHDDYRKEHD